MSSKTVLAITFLLSNICRAEFENDSTSMQISRQPSSTIFESVSQAYERSKSILERKEQNTESLRNSIKEGSPSQFRGDRRPKWDPPQNQ